MESKTGLQINNTMINPLLKNRFEIVIDDDKIELNVLNLSRYFQKIYVLCPLKNEQVDADIFCKELPSETWKDMTDKLVLEETSSRIIKNFEHNHNLLLVKGKDIEQFNKFGYELDEKILVLPLLNISYKNVSKYLKIYEGHYTLEDFYKILIINDYFSKESKLSFNSLMYISDMIKSIEESYYWTRQYNCLQNITKQFTNRMFKLKVTRNLKDPEIKDAISNLEKDNKMHNYLENIFDGKNFIDAASCLKKNGYRLYSISKKSDISKTDMVAIFSKLNKVQRYLMFSNLVISKKYCHLVLNNIGVLQMLESYIKFFSELNRYLFGYAWLRFYTEECIKKTNITKDDEFIFTIDTASLLPVYPLCMNEIKKNPYLPILVDDKVLQSQSNIGGFSFYNVPDEKFLNQGIVNLDGFKKRVNVFISGNSSNDVFKDLDWKSIGMGISGSVMTACLQKRHPLMSLFEGKNGFENISEFDLDYSRYFNEYYPEADVDIMIKSSTPLEFIKKCKLIFNQMVVNICNFNPSNVEPKHIKMKVNQAVYLFVSEDLVKKVSEEKDCSLSYDFIINNLDNQQVTELFKPYFESKIKEFNDNLYEEYSEEELIQIKRNHPELFDKSDVIDYQVHLTNKNNKFVSNNNNKEEITEEKLIDNQIDTEEEENINTGSKIKQNKLGINITFKVKISSFHISKELELFPVLGDDFFSIVSKFHLPCVRSYYDGDNVYLTPSCVSAHLTYINLDYKYFAGSNDELKIILKYRMRGFGTLLNKNEIDKIVKYIDKVSFWKRLYDVDMDNKESIKSILGSLTYNIKLFQPRLYNSDLYKDDAPYVNIIDGYNLVEEKIQPIVAKKDIEDLINNYLGGFRFNLDLIELQTIGKDGYVVPIQKDKIVSAFDKAKAYLKSDVTDKDVDKSVSTPNNLPWDSEEIVESSEDSL